MAAIDLPYFFDFSIGGTPFFWKMPCAKNFSPIFLSFFNIKVLFHKIKSPCLENQSSVQFTKIKFPFHKKSCFINQSSVQIFKIKIPSYKIKISVLSRWENVAFWPQGYVNPKTPISIRGRGYFPKINVQKIFPPYFFRIFKMGPRCIASEN